MSRTEYTKSEIDLIIKPLQDKHDLFDNKLDEILTQVKKTNGRVTSLELWKAWALGAFAVVLPVICFVAYQIITITIK